MPIVRTFISWFSGLRWPTKILVAIPLSFFLVLVIAAFSLLAAVGVFLLLDLLWDRLR